MRLQRCTPSWPQLFPCINGPVPFSTFSKSHYEAIPARTVLCGNIRLHFILLAPNPQPLSYSLLPASTPPPLRGTSGQCSQQILHPSLYFSITGTLLLHSSKETLVTQRNKILYILNPEEKDFTV